MGAGACLPVGPYSGVAFTVMAFAVHCFACSTAPTYKEKLGGLPLQRLCTLQDGRLAYSRAGALRHCKPRTG